MKLNKIPASLLICSSLLASCRPDVKKSGQAAPISAESDPALEGILPADKPEVFERTPANLLTKEATATVISRKIGDRSIEEVLCQDGNKLLNRLDKKAFLDTLSYGCGNTRTSELFQKMISNAYTGGTAEPNVELIDFKVGELFVTKMTVGFALKVPLDNPALFYRLKAHDALSSGIEQKNSQLDIKLEGPRVTFPGRRSAEKILLNYSLNKSEGGGLFDQRKTEFNTYILQEDTTDVVLATEELLDADTNRTYDSFKALLLGVKASEDGYTYLVFVNDFTIKNRIDPLRLQRTLIELNKGMQKMLYQHLATAGKS